MITNIAIQNFKCFRHVSINPKLLTVLIGPNGTGKSSILQALLLMKQRDGRRELVYQGAYVNLRNQADVAPNFLEEAPGPSISFEAVGERDPESSARAALLKLRFVPAVRGLVRRRYELGAEYAEHISLQGGFDAQEGQLATNLIYGSSYGERLSHLSKRVTGTGLQADTVPVRAIEVKSLAPAGAVNIVAEGFGANSLIQLLYQLIVAEKGATVLMEEPEIHLHPKAQAELAEVLADTAKAEDKQIIMTTHSEHLLSRLLTLVAEKKLTRDQLAICAFEKDDKGECFASEIEVTDLGQVTGGLTGVFDANLAEMDRYIKALQTKS